MQQLEEVAKNIHRNGKSHSLSLGVIGIISDFPRFQVPVTKLPPDEVIEQVGSALEVKEFHSSLNFRRDLAKPRPYPSVYPFIFCLWDNLLPEFRRKIHKNQARGVPEFIQESPSAFQFVLAEQNVLALGYGISEGKAKGIRPITLDDFHRVYHITGRFRHFPSLDVANQSVDIDFLKRHLRCKLQPEHHHPSDPEEENIKSGNQNGGGIVSLVVIGYIGPAKDGKGPESRRKPGVQNIGVGSEGCGTALGASGRLGFRHRIPLTGRAEVGRDGMSPPQLAGDAPIPNFFQPSSVDLRPGVRDKGRAFTGVQGIQGFFSQGLHREEPLSGKAGFHHSSTPLAVAYGVKIRLYLYQKPGME